MKKIVSLVATAVLAGTGLVGFTSTTSHAGDPYPGTVNTTCNAGPLNSPRAGKAAKAFLAVRTGGNGAARGRATFSYERKRNGVVVEEFNRRYQGPGRSKYSFENIPRGRYTVRVFFDSRPFNSVYQNCRTKFNQRIRPRR